MLNSDRHQQDIVSLFRALSERSREELMLRACSLYMSEQGLTADDIRQLQQRHQSAEDANELTPRPAVNDPAFASFLHQLMARAADGSFIGRRACRERQRRRGK